MAADTVIEPWRVEYRARRALRARNVTLARGDLFPVQAKSYIRGLGRAYGFKNADTCDWSALDYVQTVVLRRPRDPHGRW